jgi:hypothetical protein
MVDDPKNLFIYQGLYELNPTTDGTIHRVALVASQDSHATVFLDGVPVEELSQQPHPTCSNSMSSKCIPIAQDTSESLLMHFLLSGDGGHFGGKKRVVLMRNRSQIWLSHIISVHYLELTILLLPLEVLDNVNPDFSDSEFIKQEAPTPGGDIRDCEDFGEPDENDEDPDVDIDE